MIQRIAHQGFALVEMLVVVVIIAILGITIYSYFFQSYQKAQIAEAQQELEQIRQAMEVLYADTGYYPDGTSDICSPTANPNELRADDNAAGLVANGAAWPRWKGPYIEAVELLDPWGTPYYFDTDYDCDGGDGEPIGCEGRGAGGQNDSVIVSCGPNASRGGAGVNESCEYDNDNVVIYLCEHP